jgi:hypothetical protein
MFPSFSLPSIFSVSDCKPPRSTAAMADVAPLFQYTSRQDDASQSFASLL